MSARVAGKVALVTGGARGIGRACALRLAEEGADVVLLDIAGPVATVPYPGSSGPDLAAAAAAVEERGRQALAIVGDVRDTDGLADAVRRAEAAFGPIDIAVAAAGIDSWGAAWELDDEQWQAMLDVNLTGVWKTARAVAPGMIARRSGALVFIGSVLSHKPNAQFAHYTAAKHGVLGVMRAFALELAPFGVRANSVDPTAVYTDMVMNQRYIDQTVGHAGATVDEVKERYLRWNAMPVPWVEAVDVANAVLFLASDEARYITGAALTVDLGAMLK
jgi:SDR family mycofactocin-dependent oxidoreductase